MFLLPQAAQATAAVSGKVTDPATSSAGVRAFVRFELRGCGNNPARATQPAEVGTLILTKDFAVSTTTGAITGIIVRSDQISCAGVTTSNYYQVTIFSNGTAVPGTSQCYRITSPTFDLNSATPCATSPVVVAPTGDSTYQRLDGGNQATGNYVPNAAGRNLGAVGAEWNVFAQAIHCENINNVRCAEWFPGATAGEKIAACIANLPTTGGICDARYFEGAQTISTSIPIDRETLLLLNPSVLFTVSGSGEFAVSASCRVLGGMQSTNVLTRGTLFNITKAGGLVRFVTGASSVVEHFEWAYTQLQGGGGGNDNYLMSVPNHLAGTFDGNQARWHIHDNWFGNMGVDAGTTPVITVGDSDFWVSIERNVFASNHAGDVSIGFASDFDITHNYFWLTSTTQAHLKLIGGGHGFVSENEFENNNVSTIEDIRLTSNATSGNSSGFIWINKNKFGPEGETSTRTKIRAYNASRTTDMIQNIRITENTFSGLSGTTFLLSAIRYDNPIRDWQVKGNIFDYVTTLMDDQMVESSNQSGNSIFRDNTVKHGTNANAVLCSNGCRGFVDVEQPSGLSGDRWAYRALPRQSETPELRNRVPDSNIFTCGVTWTCTSSATVTPGQADPFGGTTASLIVNGGVSGGRISEAISNTNLGNRVVLRFWAKAGTASVLAVWLHDTTTNPAADDGFTEVKLSSTWEEYKYSLPVFAPANNWELRFYPGGETSTASQNIVLTRVQIADYDSNYLATAGGAAVDTTSGSALYRTLRAKRIAYANGTPLVIGDFALSPGWGNTAAVSNVIGTDMGWRITVTANGAGIGASPTVTLTFKDGTFTNVPVVGSKMCGGNGVITNLIDTPTATTHQVLFSGTPGAGLTYDICGWTIPR